MYHDITHDDMKNGDGLRVVLWVAGCEHKCKECQNPITWNPNNGLPFTEWEEAEIWEWLNKSWTQGITFSGGDPLHPVNRDTIGKIAENIKKKLPNKDVWLYTGYTLINTNTFKNEVTGETFELPWINHIDVLVDGRFECEVRKKDLEEKKKVLWCGSSNQRIIDIKETLLQGKVMERKEKIYEF